MDVMGDRKHPYAALSDLSAIEISSYVGAGLSWQVVLHPAQFAITAGAALVLAALVLLRPWDRRTRLATTGMGTVVSALTLLSLLRLATSRIVVLRIDGMTLVVLAVRPGLRLLAACGGGWPPGRQV